MIKDSIQKMQENLTIEERVKRLEVQFSELRSNNDDEWCDINELVEEFPFLKKQTIYQYSSEGKFPHSKVNGKLIFNKGQVRTFFSEKHRMTLNELLNNARNLMKF